MNLSLNTQAWRFPISLKMSPQKIGCLFIFGMLHSFGFAACSFDAPPQWNKPSTRWEGQCQAGQAHGLGVLKEYKGKALIKTFYGRFAAGHIAQGVVDAGDGYEAGNFVQGHLAASSERQVYVSAFAAAEQAATFVSARYAQSGNKASAKFYADKAQLLRDSVD